MVLNQEMFEAIQQVLPRIFASSPGGLTMRESRPLIENALRPRNFDAVDLHKQVYRHIHQSCINAKRPRAGYKGVRKVLWNDADRTFHLLSAAELADIADGKAPRAVEESPLLKTAVTKKVQLIARESIVRDYVARNLDHIESELTLWDSDSPAVEHVVANRRIDILAKDLSGCPVIIELKLHRAYDRVLGQALLYRGLVRKYRSVKRVRIVLIAERISRELQMAAEDVADLQMFEYKELRLEGDRDLKFTLKSILSAES